MGDRLLVGDLVRPTSEAVRDHAYPSGRHLHGPQFAARRPALVLALLHVNPEGKQSCAVAYLLKNGNWKRPAFDMTISSHFELVHRPASSHLLNPFDVTRPTAIHGEVHVFLTRKYFAIVAHPDGLNSNDPDRPIIIGDRPLVPDVLGQAIRASTASFPDHRHHFVDGRWQQPFFDIMTSRAKAAQDAACEEIWSRYKVRVEYLTNRGSVLQIRPLYDCFRLMPTTRSGNGYGPQCRESWSYVGRDCTDRELGERALEILNRPNVATDHAARTDPFISRILPYLDLAAMEADMRRHWPK